MSSKMYLKGGMIVGQYDPHHIHFDPGAAGNLRLS